MKRKSSRWRWTHRCMSMTIRDAGENRSRFDAVQALLTDPTFTNPLYDHFEIQWYTFDSTALPIRTPEMTLNDENGGPLSAIQNALHEISSRTAPDILAGIALFSDGAENTRSEIPGFPPAPVYAVGAGSPEPEPVIDREVQSLLIPQRVTVNSRVGLSVMVKCLSQEQQPLPITISLAQEDGANAQTVTSVSAEFKHPGESRLCPASFIPAATGRFRLRASTPIREGERLQENNDRTVFIDVVDPDIPVLYMEGKPRFEYKFFKRALETDEFVQLLSILRIGGDQFLVQTGSQTTTESASKAPRDLSQFKVIVLGDINPTTLGTDWLNALVEFVDKGGGLLLLGSGETFGPAGIQSAISPLLPFETDNAVTRFHPSDFTLEISGRGRAHPIFAGGLQRQDSPTITGAYNLPSLKSGASILAYYQRKNTRVPGVITQRYGQGRILINAAAATWPWELRQGALGARSTYFNQFWRQAVRWLAGLEETEVSPEIPLIVKTDAYDYYAGETVQLTAFVSKQVFPVPPALIASIDHPTEERFAFSLDPTATGASYRYTADFNPQKIGAYDMRIQALKKDESNENNDATYERSIEFLVKRSAREWERSGLNEAFLKNLSARGGAQYFPIEQARDLLGAIPPTPSAGTRLVEHEIWNRPWTLALLCIMLSVEWAHRRRYERLKPEVS